MCVCLKITDGSLNSPAIGVDGLRLWVALNASESLSDVKIGPNVILDLEKRLSQIRVKFKFMLGCLNEYPDSLPTILSHEELQLLDRVCLFLLDS